MKITGNGTFPLQNNVRWASTVIYCSAFGGATVQLQLNGLDIADGLLVSEGQFVLQQGKGANVSVVVSGYTADITLDLYEG